MSETPVEEGELHRETRYCNLCSSVLRLVLCVNRLIENFTYSISC